MSSQEIALKTLLASTLTLTLAGTSFAGGFLVDTQSARPTGMGTAVTSQIDDASAVFYNAAGVIHGKGLDVQLGDTLIAPSIAYTDPNNSTVNSKTGAFPPPHLYATYGLSDDVGFGIGLFSAYGLGSNWPSGWAGRYLAVNSSLATYAINPEVAVRPFNWLKVGVGLDFVRGVVQLDRSVNYLDSPDGTIQLAGGAWGTGANAGAIGEFFDRKLTLGAHYRGGVPLTFTGQAHFTNQPPELANTVKDQAVVTTVKLPETFNMGVSYAPTAQLRIAFDLDYTNWSDFNELAIQFTDPSLNQTSTKNWKNTFNFHLGGEYAINDQIKVRAGFVYDPSPANPAYLTPDLPAFDIIDISVGASYQWQKFRADLGYQFALLNAAKSTFATFPGSYKGNAQIVGLSLNYRM